jgi:hypothetical protein
MCILARCPRMLVEIQFSPKVHLPPSVMSRFQQQVTIDLSLPPSLPIPWVKKVALCLYHPLHTLADLTALSPGPPPPCVSQAHRVPHARSRLLAALPQVTRRPPALHVVSQLPTLTRAQPHLPSRPATLPPQSHRAPQHRTRHPVSARSLICRMRRTSSWHLRP